MTTDATQADQKPQVHSNVQASGPKAAAAQRTGVNPSIGAQKTVVREIGTIDVNDFRKPVDQLELAGRFVDSYLEKDLKYPELDRLGSRMYENSADAQ